MQTGKCYREEENRKLSDCLILFIRGSLELEKAEENTVMPLLTMGYK